jgi:hypothetical protein
MTRVDLQTRLRAFFNNDTYYQGIDFNDSIQDGYDEVCAFTGCQFASATIPFQQYLTYYDWETLLGNYVGLYAIFNAVMSRWMVPISRRKLDQFRIDWEVAAGTPWYFCPISYRYTAIYKKPIVPNYGNMYVFYLATSQTLTDTSPILIPDDHMQALENYNITDLLEQQQEFTKATETFQDYAKRLELLRVLMKNQRRPDRLSALK